MYNRTQKLLGWLTTRYKRKICFTLAALTDNSGNAAQRSQKLPPLNILMVLARNKAGTYGQSIECIYAAFPYCVGSSTFLLCTTTIDEANHVNAKHISLILPFYIFKQDAHWLHPTHLCKTFDMHRYVYGRQSSSIHARPILHIKYEMG